MLSTAQREDFRSGYADPFFPGGAQLVVLCSLFAGPSQKSDPASGQDLTQIPPQMEHAMETMMFTVHKFAEDKGYLTKVLSGKEEFPGILENQKDPLAVEKILKDVDQCCTGRAGFQSFSLIAGLTITYNDYFVIHKKQKGKKQAALNNYSCFKTYPNEPLKEISLPHSFPLYKDFMNRLGPFENAQIKSCPHLIRERKGN